MYKGKLPSLHNQRRIQEHISIVILMNSSFKRENNQKRISRKIRGNNKIHQVKAIYIICMRRPLMEDTRWKRNHKHNNYTSLLPDRRKPKIANFHIMFRNRIKSILTTFLKCQHPCHLLIDALLIIIKIWIPLRIH
jgi:hypothetical protein